MLRKSIARALSSLLTAATLAVFSTSAVAGYRVIAYAQTMGYSDIKARNYQAARQATALSSSLLGDHAVSANRCIAELLAEMPEQALKSCGDAIRQVPKSNNPLVRKQVLESTLATLLTNRGVVHAALGNKALAERDFVRAMQLDVNNMLVKNNLLLLKSWRSTGQTQQAPVADRKNEQ